VLPRPQKRRLRKAVMRRAQAKIRQGKRRILRRERDTAKAEKLIETALDAMQPLSVREVTMNVTYMGRGEPLPFDFDDIE
jgi:hypothetical protein